MLSVIQKWASFVRFSHTVFALPFALAAMAVAARDNRGWPGWKVCGLILVAMVSALEIAQMLTLAASVILWLVGFDIIYALRDYEFDRSHGLHSLVVAWGPKNALQAAFLSHLVMCGLLLAFGLLAFGLRPIAY